MTKYTKAMYLNAVRVNVEAIAAIQAKIDSFFVRIDGGEVLTDEWSEEWNKAYDDILDLENERFAVEQRWNRRAWTWQDHAEYELVSQNID